MSAAWNAGVPRLGLGVLAALGAGAIALATPASIAFGVDEPPPTAPAAVTPGSGPVSVAVVVPLTVPPTTSGLLSADALTTYTQTDGLLDRQLDAVAGSSAAIGLDPMIVASIRVLGSSAPQSAIDFLARLHAVTNEVFLLGYGDADPALASAAGIGNELSPLGFDFTIDPANFGPAETPSPVPTDGPTSSPTPVATDEPGQDDGTGPPPLPTTESLLAWPSTLPSIAWPAEGTIDAVGLQGVADLGYDDTLISGANTTKTATALVDLGSIDGLVVDDDLTSAVRDAVYAPTETEHQAALVTLSAELRSEAITAPGRTLIATLDRRWPFGTPRLSGVLAAIDTQAAAQLVPLSAVLSGPKGSASLVVRSGDPDAARADRLSTLADAARTEAAYLTIAKTPWVLTQPRRLQLLGLSAVGWRIDTVGWEAATADAIASAQHTLSAVQVSESSDQLVLSDVSNLRLHVSNALPVAVTVYVTLRPLSAILNVEDTSVEVTIDPDSTATASIPVEAIANGDVTVRAELRNAAGQEVGEARFLNVILQAGWETVGTLIAGALVLVVFGGGLIRVFLRRRRERATAAVQDEAPETAAADD